MIYQVSVSRKKRFDSEKYPKIVQRFRPLTSHIQTMRSPIYIFTVLKSLAINIWSDGALKTNQ